MGEETEKEDLLSKQTDQKFIHDWMKLATIGGHRNEVNILS